MEFNQINSCNIVLFPYFSLQNVSCCIYPFGTFHTDWTFYSYTISPINSSANRERHKEATVPAVNYEVTITSQKYILLSFMYSEHRPKEPKLPTVDYEVAITLHNVYFDPFVLNRDAISLTNSRD